MCFSMYIGTPPQLYNTLQTMGCCLYQNYNINSGQYLVNVQTDIVNRPTYLLNQRMKLACGFTKSGVLFSKSACGFNKSTDQIDQIRK